MTNRSRNENNSIALRRTMMAGTLGLLILSGTASQAQESVVVDVGACLELETREAQIECYDALVAEELQGREARDSNETPPAAAETDDGPLTRDQRRELLRAEQEQRERERESEPEAEITATVTELRELEPDSFLIYLDNDQVWRQNSPKRYNLQAGAVVELRPSRWGTSYRLTDPEVRGFIQVERVR